MTEMTKARARTTAEPVTGGVLVTVHHPDGDQLACRLDRAEARLLIDELQASLRRDEPDDAD